ncbi:MAG: 16S rRNA (cytidine(1402)-2'-O)-methyltransferase [Acidobacteriota bacterium]
MAKGRLFVVATPIGNLEDMTFRAIETLKRVSLIACEDTRETRKLLTRFDIKTKYTSYHKFNELTKSRLILNVLGRGEDVAIVSDAGTPGISDPGTLLVALVVERGFTVVPIPGASALTASLSTCGFPLDSFTFHGFLPKKKTSREKFLKALSPREETLVFFESPHRITESLSDMASILGPRKAVLCRELTKIHEEILRGNLCDVQEQLRNRKESISRGEFALIVEGSKKSRTDRSHAPLYEHFRKLVDEEGLERKEAIKALAKVRSLSKSKVYKEILMKEGKL